MELSLMATTGDIAYALAMMFMGGVFVGFVLMSKLKNDYFARTGRLERRMSIRRKEDRAEKGPMPGCTALDIITSFQCPKCHLSFTNQDGKSWAMGPTGNVMLHCRCGWWLVAKIILDKAESGYSQRVDLRVPEATA